MQINGSIALVTGANGGIGHLFVEQLLQVDVAKIYACGRNNSKLAHLVALDSNRIVPIEVDIEKPMSVSAAVNQCSDITLLINNAGTSLNEGLISSKTLDAARKEMEINYFGTLSMCRAFAPILK